MRGLQGSFGHLQIPLEISCQEERGGRLEICVWLNNLHAQQVGINQICTVYMPLCKQTQEEIWGNFENVLFGEQRCSD
jgi:hypothetical protein